MRSRGMHLFLRSEPARIPFRWPRFLLPAPGQRLGPLEILLALAGVALALWIGPDMAG